jgi:hypothetical protein
MTYLLVSLLNAILTITLIIFFIMQIILRCSATLSLFFTTRLSIFLLLFLFILQSLEVLGQELLALALSP